MRRTAALLLALALAGPAHAQLAPVTFGAKADAESGALAIGGDLSPPPYRLVRLTAKNVPEKAGVIWKVTGIDNPAAVIDWVKPDGKLPSRKTRTPEWIADPGRYRVVLAVYVIAEDGTVDPDEVEAVVTIGGTPVVPPGPSDPLLPTLQAAFKADGGSVGAAKKLAAVFRLGATTVAGDATLATRKALNDLMHRTADNAIGGDALKATREAVAVELDAKVGGKEADPLTDAERAKYRTQYSRIAGLLEALK